MRTGGGETVQFTIDKKYFTAGDKYDIEVTAIGAGWDDFRIRRSFAATARAEGENTVTLELLDISKNPTGQREIFSTDYIYLRATTNVDQI